MTCQPRSFWIRQAPSPVQFTKCLSTHLLDLFTKWPLVCNALFWLNAIYKIASWPIIACVGSIKFRKWSLSLQQLGLA